MSEERVSAPLFMERVEEKIGDIAPMIRLVLKKQARDLGVIDDAPPAKIEELIERTVSGIRYFMGDEGASLVKKHMKKIFREMAPEYNRKKIGF